jgi:hypothetical protein
MFIVNWIISFFSRFTPTGVAKRELVEIEECIYETEKQLQHLQSRLSYFRKRRAHLQGIVPALPTLTREVPYKIEGRASVRDVDDAVKSMLKQAEREATAPRTRAVTRLRGLPGKGLGDVGRSPL